MNRHVISVTCDNPPHQPHRAWRSILAGIGVEAAVLVPIAIVFLVFPDDLARFFVSDSVVAGLAADYVMYSAAIVLLYGVYFVVFRALQASGDLNSPIVISLGSAFFFACPLGFYVALVLGHGAIGIWLGVVAHAVATTVLASGWLMRSSWLRPVLRNVAEAPVS